MLRTFHVQRMRSKLKYLTPTISATYQQQRYLPGTQVSQQGNDTAAVCHIPHDTAAVCQIPLGADRSRSDTSVDFKELTPLSAR